MKHPLINPESSHYDKGALPAIAHIEEELTVTEMIGACRFNIMKYRLRLGKKDQIEKERAKINTYSEYEKFLISLKDVIGDDVASNWTVARSMRFIKLKWNWEVEK